MKQYFLILALCLGMMICGTSCSKEETLPPPSQEDGEVVVDWSGFDPKATVRGIVSCEGKGIEGVVVTDGFNMTRTNSQGAYAMCTSSDKSRFVYISVPSGYETKSERGFMPTFYQEISAPTSVESVQQFDFDLIEVNQAKHSVIVVSDIHVRNFTFMRQENENTPDICNPVNELDSVSFRKHCITYLRSYVKSLPSDTKVYGINLGDMSNESFWEGSSKGSLESFVSVCERGGWPIQTYTVIGNHEHDMAVSNIVSDDDSQAEKVYMDTFGPTYYSFNIGKVHYVVLDNVKFINSTGTSREYDIRITQEQIDWAEKDAANMDESIEHVVFCWHCPSFRRHTMANKPTVEQQNTTKAVINLYKDKVNAMTILSGHNHQSEIVTVPGYSNTTEYIHPSVSGAWWYFPLCNEGSPSTFTRYDFNGGRLSARRSVNFTYPDEQYYRLYNEGQTNAAGKKVLRMNIWDWHTDWKLTVYENDILVQDASSRISRNYMYDPLYLSTYENTGNGISSYAFLNSYKSDHILDYLPKDENAEIKIVAKDGFGAKLFTIVTTIR